MLQRGDKANSTIGEKSLFKGNFNVKGSLRIDGKYEGEHLTVEHLFVGPTGRVKTHIRSNSVVVEGLVIGTINAKTRVILHPAAKVLGDIKTPELIIQNGPRRMNVFEFGQCAEEFPD